MSFWGIASNIFLGICYVSTIHNTFLAIRHYFPKNKVLCYVGSIFWPISILCFFFYFTFVLLRDIKNSYIQRIALQHFDPFEGVDEATFDILKKEKAEVDFAVAMQNNLNDLDSYTIACMREYGVDENIVQRFNQRLASIEASQRAIVTNIEETRRRFNRSNRPR